MIQGRASPGISFARLVNSRIGHSAAAMLWAVPCAFLIWTVTPTSGPAAFMTLPAAMLGARLPDLDLLVPRAQHRGRWHSLGAAALWALLVAAPIFLLARSFGLPVMLGLFGGYVSHLAVDSTTRTGLPRGLWPWRPGLSPPQSPEPRDRSERGHAGWDW